MRQLILFLLAITLCRATVVPQLSFEDLVAKSDHVITGRVSRSSTSWGPEHKFIWTRYEIAVEETLKGKPTKIVTVSSPGGNLDGKTMSIVGAVSFYDGEHVALFLKTFSSGDELTVGWAQGKFDVDESGCVHPAAGMGSLQRLEGMSLAAFRSQIVAAARQKVVR